MGLWKKFLILSALNFADFAITRPLVNEAGPSAEWVPWLRWLIKVEGINAVWTFKLFFLCFFAFLCLCVTFGRYESERFFLSKSLTCLNWITITVVAWGLFNLIKVFG